MAGSLRANGTAIEAEMSDGKFSFERSKAALLVVDLQPDFMPNGKLPVPGGDEIVEPIGRLMQSGAFDLIIATQDWHPPHHISFASNHPGKQPMDRIQLYGHEQVLWPDHCVQGTPGAALDPRINWNHISAIIRKATDPATDSYSALRNNWNPEGRRPPTGLSGYLKNRGVDSLFICGLARDYCVKWSAEDALDEGFRVWMVWDLCRAIDQASDEPTRTDLTERGAQIITASQLSTLMSRAVS
jgi:nicotinamidase/pyrazinamidase